MFSKILVPLDGTAHAERALPYAVALAQRSGGRLILLRAAHLNASGVHRATDHAPTGMEEAEDYLHRQIHQLLPYGIFAEAVVPYGETTDWIVRVATSHHSDLIVMTARTLESWVGGSPARIVIEHTIIPVLLVPETAAPVVALGASTRLVVPLDGTVFAEEAVPIAARLAQQLGGELVLLRAVPTIDHPTTRAAARYLDQLIVRTALQGRQIRSTVRIGTPAEAIAALARESNATVLVMATHLPDDRTSIDRLREGSVTEAAFRHSGVPLLLIRSHLAQDMPTTTHHRPNNDRAVSQPDIAVLVKEVAPPGGGLISAPW